MNLCADHGPKPLSAVCYDRISTILESEPLIKPKLGPKNFEIVARNGSTIPYHKLVVDIVVVAYRVGLNPQNVSKEMVLKIAAEELDFIPKTKRVFVLPPPMTSQEEEVQVAEPPPLPPTPPPRKKRTRIAKEQSMEVAAPVPSAHADEKAVVTPPKRRGRKRIVAETIAKEVAAEKPVAAAAPVLEQRKPLMIEPGALSPPAPEPEHKAERKVVVYTNLSKLSLCVSLYNLMQLDDDKFPGFEDRNKAVNFLIADFARIKDLPVSTTVFANGKA